MVNYMACDYTQLSRRTSEDFRAGEELHHAKHWFG